MLLIHPQINQKDGFFTYPPPLYAAVPPLPQPPSSGARITPAVLFILVILAVLFFLSGILHLLVRFLVKHPFSSQSNRYPEISSTDDVLQRQLQQLFNLHDSGLDQAFIDALPVFMYKEIVGLNEPFDCAVCLCEFSDKDKLRLLPMCSHAFHINCIDTWLLSNSTCPLCRATLFNPGFAMDNPIFDYDDMLEEDRCVAKTVEMEGIGVGGKEGLSVRLGKFRKLSNEAGDKVEEETSSSSLDARRCYSMGSYQYVVDDSVLRVALDHGRDRNGVNGSLADGNVEGKRINSVSKGESYSVSKIWLWPKKGQFSSNSDIRIGMPSSWPEKTRETSET